MKKILLLVPQNIIPATDGGKQSIYYPMQILAKNYNVQAIVFVGNNEKQSQSDYELLGIKPHFVLTDKSDNPFKLILNIFQKLPFKFTRYFSKKNITKVLDICRNFEPDLVVCHHAHLGYYGKLIKNEIPKIKLILREHNIEYLIIKQYAQVKKNLLVKAIAYWQYIKAKNAEISCWFFFDEVLFISNSDINEAEKNIGKQSYKLLYDGANFVEKKSTKKENVILFTGNLSALQNEYNFNYFIKTIWIPFCESTNNLNLELWVTGNKEEFFQLKTGLSEVEQHKFNIKVMGFVENITDVIQQAKYFLSPTIIGAGIRLKVLEAACNGSVILCTSIDYSMLPYFEDFNNIVLYTDYKSFVNKLNILENNQEIYEKISENIYTLAKEKLTWGNFVEKYKQVVESF